MNRDNLANALLGAPLSDTDTAATLGAGYGSGMPATPFKITITPFGQLSTKGNSEIILVTARSSDNLTTIVRGQNGTTAKSFDEGAVVSNGVYVQDIDPRAVATQETPNNSRTLYTVPGGKYVAGTLSVWVNGLLQLPGTDFTETAPGSGTFTLDTVYPSTSRVTVTFQAE